MFGSNLTKFLEVGWVFWNKGIMKCIIIATYSTLNIKTFLVGKSEINKERCCLKPNAIAVFSPLARKIIYEEA